MGQQLKSDHRAIVPNRRKDQVENTDCHDQSAAFDKHVRQSVLEPDHSLQEFCVEEQTEENYIEQNNADERRLNRHKIIDCAR